MTMLLNVAVATPVAAAVSAPMQMRPMGGAASPGLTVQSNFIYGSGGTSGTVWVQTSLDGGTTWTDVATFAFLLANLRQALPIGSLGPAGSASALTLGDGAASVGAIAGLLGTLWRTKLTTLGTYAASTLRIDIDGIAFTSMP